MFLKSRAIISKAILNPCCPCTDPGLRFVGFGLGQKYLAKGAQDQSDKGYRDQYFRQRESPAIIISFHFNPPVLSPSPQRKG